ncbi:Uncharacterised protein g6841 [Pycnogonum litorale]
MKLNQSKFGDKTAKESAKYTGGLRDARTTGVFRAVNFELFVKPNKFVMGFGLVAITGCVAFLAYMNVQSENNKQTVYFAENEDGSQTSRLKKSKWDN